MEVNCGETGEKAMKMGAWTVGVYAVILLVGGLIGYLKAGSVVSIAISGACSLFLAICAYQGFKKKFGWLLSAALVMIVLNFFFIYRLLTTHKMMPAGMMAVVTTLLGIPLLAVLKREVSDLTVNE